MKPAVAIVGGGAAGLFAAVTAARVGARVTVLEKVKLLLRGGGIAAVQIGIALATRLTAAPFAKVILDFAILRMPLHPGVVILFIAGLRAQPEQRLTQAAVRLFIAAGHRLQQGDPFPAGLFPPG